MSLTDLTRDLMSAAAPEPKDWTEVNIFFALTESESGAGGDTGRVMIAALTPPLCVMVDVGLCEDEAEEETSDLTQVR